MSWPACSSCPRSSTISSWSSFLVRFFGRRGKQRKSQKTLFSSHGRDVTTWCLQPVSAEWIILLGSLPPEIPVALIIILAARHIDLTGPCCYLLCTSLFPSSGAELLAGGSGQILHHGNLGLGYLDEYLMDMSFRAII